ncbi:MAG: RIO1 family regulatory kinase/ATPase [Anaerolineae bacterium]
MLDYEGYEVKFETRAERRRKARPQSRPKRKEVDVRAELVERFDSSEFGFQPSYKSSHHDHGEMQWIISALSGFYADKLIDDVLRVVKGGKEASVYVCAAHPSTGVDFIAAKIYRPRMFRSLKNDAMYREGRSIIGEEGKTIKARDKRVQRAVQQMTRFGQELRTGSWIGHEYETLRLLYEADVDIPKPYAQGGNAIMMEYLGDDQSAAPTLNHLALEPDEAQPLFDRVMRNIEIMLARHRIHADLSAYNILYWDGEIKIIDFPQAVDPRVNPHSYALLARDVERVCQYFARYGVKADPVRLAKDMWRRYMRGAEMDT